MCGIAFVINYDTKNTIDLDMVKSMFASMKRRGTEASGMYIERQVGSTTKRVHLKAPLNPTNYGLLHKWKLIIQSYKKLN